MPPRLKPWMTWLMAGLALAGLGILYGRIALRPGLGSLADDGVSYLLMAACWSPWSAPDPALAAACLDERYPPLFPLLLALTGGAEDARLAHAVSILGPLLALPLLYRLARGALSPLSALLCAALFALSPLVWSHLRHVISEHLFLPLLLLTLLAWEREPAAPRFRLAVALPLAGLLFTRSLGLAVALALALDHGRRRRASGEPLAPGSATLWLPLLLSLAWSAAHPPGGAEMPSYGQEWLGVWHQATTATTEPPAPSDATGATSGVFQGQALVEAWPGVLIAYWRHETEPAFLLAAGFGLLALGGLGMRLRQGRPDGTVVLITLALLSVWPAPGQMPRFLYGLAPLLLFHGMVGLEGLGALLRLPDRPRRWLTLGLVGTLLLLAANGAHFMSRRAAFSSSPPGMDYAQNADFLRLPDLDEARRVAADQERLRLDLEELARSVPPGEAVLSAAPNYVAWVARRRAFSLAPLTRPEELTRRLQATGARWIYLSRYHPRFTRREFNGLAPLPWVERVARPVWVSLHPETGEPSGVLLRVNDP
ncbi:MAG: hypothetical protein HQL51_09850 [Magnetococcales bacterium]|nr:hypothetical protein [Magnetococcales bacterium]